MQTKLGQKKEISVLEPVELKYQKCLVCGHKSVKVRNMTWKHWLWVSSVWALAILTCIAIYSGALR